jgi:hypothetical protein
MPHHLATEIMYLLPKSYDTKETKNYRLITCLSTMYKMSTGITARRISLHKEKHNLLPAEGKGCHSERKEREDNY